MVRWRETVLCLAASGVEEIVEIGAGRVLTGLVKRIDPNMRAGCIGTPAEISRPESANGNALRSVLPPSMRQDKKLSIETIRGRSDHEMFDLTGQTALVTGASGGIGGAIVRALHRQGAEVTLAGTRRAALAALAAELGERAHIAVADLADIGCRAEAGQAAEIAMGRSTSSSTMPASPATGWHCG